MNKASHTSKLRIIDLQTTTVPVNANTTSKLSDILQDNRRTSACSFLSASVTAGGTCSNRRLGEVSPGKIPPADKDHYLGTNETSVVRLEYPKSFVLQETVGDLVFKLNLTAPVNRTDIYIPPEFKVNLDKTYLWSSINNSYGQIGITKLSSSHKIAPNWYDVSVTNGGNETRKATKPSDSGHATSGTIWNGTRHTIRLFNVTAPSIVVGIFSKFSQMERQSV